MKGRQNRKERIPFGVQRRVLNLDHETNEKLKRENKVPRWINDDDHGMRLMSAQQGGYEFVYAEEGTKIGDIKEVQAEDRRIRKLVGTHKDGSAKYAYLMAIDKKYYDEDQAKKEEVNAKVDEAIMGGNPPGLQNHGIQPSKGGTYVKNINYTP